MTAPFLTALAAVAGALALAGALLALAHVLRPPVLPVGAPPPATDPTRSVGLHSWHLAALAAALQVPLVLLLLWALGFRVLAAAGAAALLAPAVHLLALAVGLAYAWRLTALGTGPPGMGAAHDPGDDPGDDPG
ncbi:MAG: hypothetical protein ABIL09_13990 [Gemmatimonadota bacterium]